MLSTDLVHDVTRVLAALSLLAAYKMGRGGGWTRARQRRARPAVGVRSARMVRSRGSASIGGPCQHAKRRADRLRLALAAICAALLLSVLAYAEVKGGAGLAEFEAVDLAHMAE